MSVFVDQVRRALEQWNKATVEEPALADLHVVRQRMSASVHARQAVGALLDESIRMCAALQVELADLLRSHYFHGETVQAIAHRMGVSDSTFHRRRRDAIALLTAHIQQRENELLAAHAAGIETTLHLPITDILVGLEQPLQLLRELIWNEESHWITTVEGIGGIGKTALATAFVRDSIQRPALAGFGWVSAYQGVSAPLARMRQTHGPETLSADLLESLIRQIGGDDAVPLRFSVEAAVAVLRELLHSNPHLIVVDNLETTVDLTSLLPVIHTLSNPTRFVLTSRQSVAQDPSIARYVVAQLGEADAYELIRQLGQRANLPHVAALTDTDLQPVYTAVGGNPLALRLLVGQMHTYPLGVVLKSMQEAHGTRARELYNYIYQRSWDALAEPAQHILLAMAMTPTAGITFDTLATMSGQTPDVMMDALDALQAANLIAHRSVDTACSVYSIHSLTRTFLLSQAGRLQ